VAGISLGMNPVSQLGNQFSRMGDNQRPAPPSEGPQLVEPVPVVDCIVSQLVKFGESNALKSPSEVADSSPEEVNVKVPVTTGSDEVVPVTEDSKTLAPVDSMSNVMGSVPEDTDASAPPLDSVSNVMGSVPEDTDAPAPPLDSVSNVMGSVPEDTDAPAPPLDSASDVMGSVPEDTDAPAPPVDSVSDVMGSVPEDTNTPAPVDSMSNVMGSVPEDINTPAPPVDSMSDVMGSLPEDTSTTVPVHSVSNVMALAVLPEDTNPLAPVESISDVMGGDVLPEEGTVEASVPRVTNEVIPVTGHVLDESVTISSRSLRMRKNGKVASAIEEEVIDIEALPSSSAPGSNSHLFDFPVGASVADKLLMILNHEFTSTSSVCNGKIALYTDEASRKCKVLYSDFSRLKNKSYITCNVLNGFFYLMKLHFKEKDVTFGTTFAATLFDAGSNHPTSKLCKALKSDVTASLYLPFSVNDNHWILVVIHWSRYLVEIYDPLDSKNGDISAKIIKVVRKVKKEKGNSRWSVNNHYHDSTVQRQMDAHSCAFFTCWYAYQLIKHGVIGTFHDRYTCYTKAISEKIFISLIEGNIVL
jgi:hypothetical protein